MAELKLFVWNEFSPDYTVGLAFAIAETEEEARKLVIEEYGMDACSWGILEIKAIEPCGYAVAGGG